MERYKEYISNLAKNGIDNTFINTDNEHALEVFKNLFQIAKSELRIFAGCLCNSVANHSDYIEKISDFIEKGGKIRILLNKFENCKLNGSNLFLRLAYYKSLDKDIVVKCTKVRPYYTDDAEKKEIHFTVVDDNAYRIETDIEKRTANCNFNNNVIGKDLVSFFDKIFNDSKSTEIDLLELFNLK